MLLAHLLKKENFKYCFMLYHLDNLIKYVFLFLIFFCLRYDGTTSSTLTEIIPTLGIFIVRSYTKNAKYSKKLYKFS